MASRLALYLLGPPRVELDGELLKLDRHKALALLAYLAVTGERQRRDALVNLLWPDYDTHRGRGALRRTLYALNQTLPGPWLEADREEIGLTPAEDPSIGAGQELWVDVLQFRRHLAECETHGHPPSSVCAACVAHLTEAVALAHGEFLSGFGLKDSFNFDDWALFQAEALRRELAGALERLVHWHTTQREFEPAIGYARRRLALDPLDEGAHRQLMRLHAWSGRRSAALRQYEECMALLDDQLGVPPQEATTQLHLAIQDARPAPLPELHEGPAGVPSPEDRVRPPAFLTEKEAVEPPVFVARERELGKLERFLDLALAGRGQVVLVTGDAGSGKTALVQEFTRRAQRVHPDLIAATGNCNAHTGIGDPYLPFREILDLLTGDVEARWAAGAMGGEHARRLWNAFPRVAQALVEAGPDLVETFVPRAALRARAAAHAGWHDRVDWLARLDDLAKRRPTTAPLAPGPQQSDLFAQYTRVLQAVAQGSPLLLVLDDLQWADLGSTGLLFHLGRHLAGNRILIVGAYRPEDVALGREGARHPLEPVANEFQRDFGDIIVDLARAERRGFVEALLDSEPNRLGGEFRETLYRQTRGHPLFTIELLRGLQERGDLVHDPAGRWVAGPALDWRTLPARVEAAIRERISRLAEPLRVALQVASVEGEVFTAEVVARVQATGEREILTCLSGELDRRHRLVRAEAIEHLGARRISRYRFRNYLFQEYLYASLDPAERAYLHEDVGHVLEELYGGNGGEPLPIAPQLARHFEQAGLADKAICYLQQAAERAVQFSAYREVIAHATRGLALLKTLPPSPRRDQQELALRVTLGMARTGDGSLYQQIEETEAAHARARTLGQQTGKPAQLCQVVGEMSIFHYVRAEHRRALDLGEEALGLALQTGDPLLIAWCRWHLGFVLFARGEYTAARAQLEQVLDLYVPEQHHAALVRFPGADAGLSAMAYEACCLWCLGYPHQALQQSQQALTLAHELDHPLSLADVLSFGGCQFQAMCRDGRAVQDHAKALRKLSINRDVMGWFSNGVWYGGIGLVLMGRIPEGITQLREGIAAFRAEGKRTMLPTALGFLAEALAQAGKPAEALVTLADGLALAEEAEEHQWEPELYRLRAELLLSEGDDARAEASLQIAIKVARQQQARSWELRATTSLARLYQAQGRRDEARQILAEIYGWFTEGFDSPDLQAARALLEEFEQL
jgi:DNA-binding SARP family transcriptional activator/predicted ATPase